MRLHVLLIAAFVALAQAYDLSFESTPAPRATGQGSYLGSSEATSVASPECLSVTCGLTLPDDNGERS